MRFSTWKTCLSRWTRTRQRGRREKASRLPSFRPWLEALETRLAPAVHQWVGRPLAFPGADENAGKRWSIDANWLGGSPVGDPNAILVFPATAQNFESINDLGDIPIQEIDLFGSGYSIGAFNGGRILLGSGGINASNASGNNVIAAGLTLNGADRTVNVSAPGGQLRLFNVIDGSAGLVKNGLGTLELSGVNANTFTGALTVNNGTVRLNKNAVNVTAVSGSLVIGSSAGSAGTVILDRSEQIANTSAITINRQGVLNLNNALESIGPLTINGGTLSTGASGVAGLLGNVTATSVAFVPPGGSITIKKATISGLVSLINPITFTVADGLAEDDLIVSANLFGSGALTKAGPGQMLLSGNNGNYAGEITVSGGILRITGATGLGSSAAGTTVASGATLDVDRGLTIAEPLSLNGAGVASGGGGALRNSSGSGPTMLTGNITLASSTTVNVLNNSMSLTGVISGPGGLTKVGSGLLELANANSYQGVTTVGQGFLAARNALALGSSTAGTTVQDGATLRAQFNGTNDEPLTLNGAGVAPQAAGLPPNGAVFAAGSPTFTGPVTLAGNTVIVTAAVEDGGSGTNLTLSGAVSGPFELTIGGGIGGSVVTFAGNAPNNYGGTRVQTGNLALNKSPNVNAVPGALIIENGSVIVEQPGQIPDTVPVTINGPGQGDFNGLILGADETIGPLTLNGGQVTRDTSQGLAAPNPTLTLNGDVSASGRSRFGTNVSLGGATRTFTVAASGILETDRDQTVSGGAGVGLIKAGAGQLVLRGTNTFTGPTTVNAGTLFVGSSASPISPPATMASPVTANAGTILTGFGQYSNIAAAGATVNPGNEPPPPGFLVTPDFGLTGVMLVNGAVTFNGAASTFHVDLNGTAPVATRGLQPPGSDQLSVTGTVNLGGATLEVALGSDSAVGDTFVIIENDGNDPITGRFAGLPNNGDTFLVNTPAGQQRFLISYNGNDGNDVELIHINTPSMAENLRVTPDRIHEGQTVTLTGNLTDPDAGDQLVLEVDWADGSPIETFEPGTDPFRLTHRYTSSGTFAAHLLWRDDHGEGNSQDLTVTVLPGFGVESTVVNDGAAQRSRVTSLTVTFSDIVTLDRGAFVLRRDGGGTVKLNVASSVLDGRTVAVLTFRGKGVTAGSLADGNYTLTIRADKVHDSAGQALDGDDDGTAGGDHLDRFFRLFGDSDGDRDVDQADRDAFSGTFGKKTGQEGFLAFFDFDGDGDVDGKDQKQFNRRFGNSLPA